MPHSRTYLGLLAVFFAALVMLGVRSGANGIATSYVDPVAKIQAQDEAVYAASSIRMATAGDWLTPRFLNRFALYKPPLLYWLSATSLKIAGFSAAALRAPNVIASALSVTLLFAWIWRVRSLGAALSSALLLLSNREFHTLARTATMDSLLLLWTLLALVALARDPALHEHANVWIFGAATGLAIMTKAVAGVLPLIVLVVYCCLARRADRPAMTRVLQVFGIAALVAAPWHVYQLIVHPVWFWKEYILTEHLALGLSSPQTSAEHPLVFYARRLWMIDPVLCVAALLAIPGLFRVVRLRTTHSMLACAWIGSVLLTLAAFQYRAAWYLLPLIGALAFLAGHFTIGLNRRFAVALMAIICVAKTTVPDQAFGLPYRAQSTIPAAHTLEDYCQSGNAAPLFLLEPKDQFYAADLALPGIRYVFIDSSQNAEHAAMDFGYLGITVTANQFRNLDALRPIFRERLRAWGLDSDAPIASVILARSVEEVAQLQSQGVGNFLNTTTGRLVGSQAFVVGVRHSEPCRF